MRRAPFLAAICVFCAASLSLRGEEPVVSIGKQRAARAATAWNVQDIDHAQLGPIKFAVQKDAIVTPAGKDRILSLSFVSCQKSSGKVAIELTNAPGSDPAGGLRPTEAPRLVCSKPAPGGKGALVKSDLAAKWEIGPLGDPLARGLSPSDLRRCVSIDVYQSVALASGASSKSQRFALEITPYDRALDTVFAACGETSAYATSEQPAPAIPPVAQAAPAGPPVAQPAPAPDSAPIAAPAAPADGRWKAARTVSKGKTNVRAAPSVDSRIVVGLDPGTKVLAKRRSASWWEVKPRSGAGFAGFIRQDRLVLE